MWLLTHAGAKWKGNLGASVVKLIPAAGEWWACQIIPGKNGPSGVQPKGQPTILAGLWLQFKVDCGITVLSTWRVQSVDLLDISVMEITVGMYMAVGQLVLDATLPDARKNSTCLLSPKMTSLSPGSSSSVSKLRGTGSLRTNLAPSGLGESRDRPLSRYCGTQNLEHWLGSSVCSARSCTQSSWLSMCSTTSNTQTLPTLPPCTTSPEHGLWQVMGLFLWVCLAPHADGAPPHSLHMFHTLTSVQSGQAVSLQQQYLWLLR